MPTISFFHGEGRLPSAIAKAADEAATKHGAMFVHTQVAKAWRFWFEAWPIEGNGMDPDRLILQRDVRNELEREGLWPLVGELPKQQAPRKRSSAKRPHDSPWKSTLARNRTRKPITLTISDASRALMDRLGEHLGRSNSETVEVALRLLAERLEVAPTE